MSRSAATTAGERVFAGFARWLRPGGSRWVFDLVAHESPSVERLWPGRSGG